MEGLLVAELLVELQEHLPVERLSWSFPAAGQAALPLKAEGEGGALTLLIDSSPPEPHVELTVRRGLGGPPNSTFQEQLRTRAVGSLLRATQPKLDRVLRLEFGGVDAFAPLPPVSLVIELTGRNANLILLDEDETILGVERVILSDKNRYRELKPGLRYVPPPPYTKLDPRGATVEELEKTIRGARIDRVRQLIDGVGPQLSGALVRADRQHSLGALAGAEPLAGERLTRVAGLIFELARHPTAFLHEYGGAQDEGERAATYREALLKEARKGYEREVELARRRLADAERALTGGKEAERLREEGNLLLAYLHQVPRGASAVTLPGFSGESVELELDPSVDPKLNADRRFIRAKRREVRAKRAEAQLEGLREAVTRAQEGVEGLHELTVAELEALVREAKEEGRRARSAPKLPGIRLVSPQGFEVVIGRNARDNDKVTFQVGRSRDLWFHAQGYRGSHVIVRSGGREVPFQTVLFAARLAAGHSEAFRSSNVPVDYTERKNVWKVKGAPPGAVNFSQQRTVYVNPARGSDVAAQQGEADPN